MRKLYCFDFDGTLSKKDTMLLFLKFVNPTRFRAQFIKYIPLFAFVKLGLMNTEKVKQEFISAVIGGIDAQKLNDLANAFFEKYYPQIIRTTALDFLNKVERSHTEMLLVTASLDIWVRPFAEKFEMKLISTEAEFKNGEFTGKFATANCNGEEKVRRIEQEIRGKRYDKRIAFGDTSGDVPMLKWADEGLYRFFN